MSCRRRSKNQLSITNTLIIPDNKPDIERILRVTSTPEINRVSTVPGKVVFVGNVDVFVEYVACSQCNSQPVHFAAFKVPFAHFIDHRFAQPDQEAHIGIFIEFQEVRVIDRRTINIFFILQAVVLQLGGAKCQVKSQVCPTHNIKNISTVVAAVPCTQANCITDCSANQPCSCVICNIDS